MSATASPVPVSHSPPNPAAEQMSVADAASWAGVKERLRVDDTSAFDAWLAKLEFDHVAENAVTLSAPTLFLRRWVETHYLPRLLAAWREAVASVTEVRVTVRPLMRCVMPACRPAIQAAAPPASPSAAARQARAAGLPVETAMRQDLRFGSPLDPRFTFATFVEAESNAPALAAAKDALAIDPAHRRGMNPLYLHARGVGLGKTHLLQAIVALAGPDRATYLTVERFCGNVVGALRRLGSFSAPAEIFTRDVVAIDDIQFISGAPLRREFARLLERLMEDGRQVVLASDRAPDQHDLFDDRLRSRLAGGLAVRIERMEPPLRRAVLAQHIAAAAELHPGFAVPDAVAAMVAELVTRDGRDLEAAVNRLRLLARTHGEIALPAARDAIGDLVRVSESKAILIETIQGAVARHFAIARHDMVSQRRTAVCVRPRQVAMYLAKQLTLRSLPDIGRRFGGRDHTTVLHAVRKIAALAAKDDAFAAVLTQLEQEIRTAA